MQEFFKMYNNLVIYTLFFVVAIIFSVMINGLFLRFFKTLGMRNNADGTVIRWGRRAFRS